MRCADDAFIAHLDGADSNIVPPAPSSNVAFRRRRRIIIVGDQVDVNIAYTGDVNGNKSNDSLRNGPHTSCEAAAAAAAAATPASV
jgi:hypothetical protein